MILIASIYLSQLTSFVMELDFLLIQCLPIETFITIELLYFLA